jgi:hypothetical protein
MPAPRTDIDEQGVAARIALQGIRPTARALDLPVATVRDIAYRNNVKVPDMATRLVPASTQERVQQRPAYREGEALSTQPAHAVLTDEVASKGSRGRLAAARIGCTTLEGIADTVEAEPERGVILVDSALTAAKLMQTSNVPGFERQSDQAPAQVLVQVGLLAVAPPTIADFKSVESGPLLQSKDDPN